MSQTVTQPRTNTRPETQRPPLFKVILLNDDFTPREFVVQVLKAVFRMNAERAYHVMMTAHRRGACVIAVYTRDVAETKAKEATELGKSKGYPLFFTTEPEEEAAQSCKFGEPACYFFSIDRPFGPRSMRMPSGRLWS